MNAPGFEIITPGPLTTVQDMGRLGYLGRGICPSGCMDPVAARLANALAGNTAYGGDAPALLEMTLAGISARFQIDTIFAMTGAAMPLTLNGQPINAYESIRANAGDELHCGFAAAGCRAYLAVAGGFIVPRVMGSRSTHLKCGFGGFEGRKLRAGDVVPMASMAGGTRIRSGVKTQPPMARTTKDGAFVIGITDGPQRGMLKMENELSFTLTEFTVSPQSDRMGVRLTHRNQKPPGETPFTPSTGTDILSDAIPPGAIQITNDGTPIVLMADRQTIGGYAKPFVVIEADMPSIAQLRPGDRLYFRKLSMSAARRENAAAWTDTALKIRRIEDNHSGIIQVMGFKLRGG